MSSRCILTAICILFHVFAIKSDRNNSGDHVINNDLVKNVSCPVGWHPSTENHYCYYFSNITDTNTWVDAAIKCISYQSTLAHFRNLSQLTSTLNGIQWNAYWVGLIERSHSAESHRYWTWINGAHFEGGIPIVSPWKPNTNGSVTLNSSKCAAFGRNPLGATRLFERYCDKKLPYVCMTPDKNILESQVESVEWYCGADQICYATLKRTFYSYWEAQHECRLTNSRAHLPVFDNSTQWESFLEYRNHKDMRKQRRTAWLGYTVSNGEWLSYNGDLPKFWNWTLKSSFKHDSSQNCVVSGWDTSGEWSNGICTDQYQTVCQMFDVANLTTFKRYDLKSVSKSKPSTTLNILIVSVFFTTLITAFLLLRRGNKKCERFTNEQFSKLTSIIFPRRKRLTEPTYANLYNDANEEGQFC